MFPSSLVAVIGVPVVVSGGFFAQISLNLSGDGGGAGPKGGSDGTRPLPRSKFCSRNFSNSVRCE